ncbi:hypothetical protein H0G86_006612 [Trichoderma simmonsii]|uniref:Uncharacterized protein n=1 Tax=Trichoderma simmonsii TaxID=1491479 RepID=A0A8G0PK39_9HYPO|nr:hypothetical protein H0G86_006612 [Trichoderma simmonsii]
MEPLDALQSLINDVLVQTGKALRASRRDAQGNLTHAYGPTQSKLPDTIDHFHNALNELESEIVSGGSISVSLSSSSPNLPFGVFF